MSKELVLSTKDFNAVGISSSLTSNDLVEVVANDIYEKFMDEIKAVQESTKMLRGKYQDLMKPEFDEMQSELVKAKMLGKDEAINTGYSKVNGDDWGTFISCHGLDVCEKDRGTKVTKDTHEFGFSYPKMDTANVKLKITCDERDSNSNSKISGIVCKVDTTIRKEFEKIIKTSTRKFKEFKKEIERHNERVGTVMELMPANGILSVERFTREARVKMNKKIISAQSPDFREKISKLFNIKL